MAQFNRKEKTVNLPKRMGKNGDLPDNAEDWVAYINKAHDSGLVDRTKYEFAWALNLAYYSGLQSMTFNARTKMLEIPKEDVSPLVVNRISAFVDSRHAKLTKSRPTARVIPDTQDIVDQRAARYADQALAHLWRSTDVDAEYDRAIKLMLICGVSFIEGLWDAQIGDYVTEIKKSKDGMDLLLSDEMEIQEEKTFLGDIATTGMTPFSIIPANDMIPDIKNQPYIIKRSHHPVMDIEHMFPNLKGKVQKSSKHENRTEYEKMVQRLGNHLFSSPSDSGGHGANDTLNTEALIKTFWMRPNHQYEQGVVAVVVGDQLAMIDKWPDDYGKKNVYPIVKLQEHEDGFHFFPPSTVERVIPIQRHYNRYRQQLAKNVQLMSNPKYLLAKGAQVLEDSLTDEEGEVVEYNPAAPAPAQMAIAPIPNYVIEHGRELIVDFRDVAQTRELSTNPIPGLTAGVAIQTAAELSDEPLGPIVRRLSRSMERLAGIHMMLIDQNYEEKRKIKILGQDGEVGVQWLSSADFRNQTDVHVEIESMFPSMRSGQRQTLLDLWDRRLIDDPAKVLKAFRYGTFETILEGNDRLEDTVHIGINMLKRGKAPVVMMQDNHLLWVKELSKWIQSPDFLRLIPERKQAAIDIMQQHLEMVMQQMPNQAQPMEQQNQAAVGQPQGAAVPEGGA